MAELCSVGGGTCRGVYSRGMCRIHYERWRVHGDPHTVLKPARHGTLPRYNAGCRCEKCGPVATRSAPLSAAAHAKRWRTENRERRLATRERWEAAHPETVRLSAWATEQRRRGLPPTNETVAYAKVLFCDPCTYCGGSAGQIDHIVAQLSGGDGEWTNLTAACGSCNSQKHTKLLLHFMLDRVG